MSPTPVTPADEITAVPRGDALLKRVRDTLQICREAEVAIGQQSADLARVRKQVEDAKAGRAKLTQSFSAKAAEALATGEELPDPSESDLRRIKKFNQTIASAEGAFKVLGANEAEARGRLSAARFDLANATIELMQAVRDYHASRIRNALSSVLSSIATLSATDDVQSSMLGRDFEFDGRLASRLFSGSWVAKTIAKALPGQVCPNELSSDVMARASSQSAARMLAALKDQTQ